MTTIIASRSQMGADTFLTDGARSEKIMIGPGYLLGAAGDSYYMERLTRWVVDGRRGLPPPAEDAEDKEGIILCLTASSLSLIDHSGAELFLTNEFYAVGTGAPYALGAMATGAPIATALEIAATYDEATKPPFMIVDLPKRRKK